MAAKPLIQIHHQCTLQFKTSLVERNEKKKKKKKKKNIVFSLYELRFWNLNNLN